MTQSAWAGCNFHHPGKEQGLGRGRRPPGLQRLVEDAFVGRVLVDEDEPVGPLGQDVGLGQGAQDGQVLKAKGPGAGVGDGARGQGALR